MAVMTSPLRVASSCCGHHRLDHDVAEQRENGFEVAGEAGARDREQVPGDVDGERDAAAVELVGDLVGRSDGRAAIDHAAEQVRRARRIGRIADGPGTNRQVDRHGRRLPGFLGEHDDAVVERRAGGLEPGGRAERGLRASSTRHSERIEPADGAVRGRQHRPPGVGHLRQRDRLDPRREVRKDVHAGDRLEVAELVSDVRDAVVVEDEPGMELRLGPLELRRA